MWWLSFACVVQNEAVSKDQPAETVDSTGDDTEPDFDTSSMPGARALQRHGR